jgi:hypothetical protein
MFDIKEINKKSIETTKKNLEVFAKGAQTIASEVTDYSKKTIESGQTQLEKLMSVKSAEQAIQMQMEFAKSAMEGFTAHATKVSAMYADLAKAAFKPMQDIAPKMEDLTPKKPAASNK